MGLKDDLLVACTGLVTTKWETRDGRKVPDVEAVALRDGAVDIECAVLYADLANSTGLVTKCNREFAAKVTRVFLYAASQVCKKSGGEIRSFDGDRVMAVFVGDDSARSANEAAFRIVAARSQVIIPALKSRYTTWDPERSESWIMNFGVGLDRGDLTVIRAGVRGDNDLAWLGPAANQAAKLSALREGSNRVYCTPGFFAATPFKKDSKENPVWTISGDARYYRSSCRLDL